MAAESKGKLKARLIAEGKWHAFVKEREALKEEGIEPTEAWRIAAAKFPPTGRAVALGTRRAAQAEALGRNMAMPQPWCQPRPPAEEAVLWVGSNLDSADVQPADAPSPAAWQLLCWARQSLAHRDRFWETIFARLLPTAEGLDLAATVAGLEQTPA